MAQFPYGKHNKQVQRPGGDTISMLGVKINPLPVDEVIDYILHTANRGNKAIVAYANVHAINLAQDIPWFRDFLNQAELTYCDGFGIKWGARVLGFDIPERFTPPDWFPALAQRCVDNGLSFYFLGARPGIADKAAQKLKLSLPDLQIVGTHHGYFDKTPHNPENNAIIQEINRSQADILVIGFGMPLQENWIKENWEQIDSKVVLPVGALFDYLADDIPRAPNWITGHGFEWLGRLIYEPGRLWPRYLIGNPRFMINIFKERFRRTTLAR